MAILPIVQLGNSVLRKKAESLVRMTAVERKLIQDMIDTMYFTEGVGLAANQVGVSQRIIIISPTCKRGEETVIINPEILSQKGRRVTDREGCLSVPGFAAKVTRSNQLQVKGLAMDGTSKVWELEGFAAVIVQHEVDHINGHLFIDHLKYWEKHRLEKWLRQREEALGQSI